MWRHGVSCSWFLLHHTDTLMIALAGKLPLNIYMIHRTMFSTVDEASKFKDSALGAYTFLVPTPLSEIITSINENKGGIVLVPLTPHMEKSNEK